MADWWFSLPDWIQVLLLFWGALAPPMFVIGVLIMKVENND